jgi:hypothetical protein
MEALSQVGVVLLILWAAGRFALLGRGVQTRVVRAQRLEIVDRIGRPRIVATTGEDGNAVVSVLDTTGKPRAAMGTYLVGGGFLSLMGDSDNNERVLIAEAPDGSCTIALHDAAGALRAGLEIRAGNAQLHLLDSAGKIRVACALAGDGMGLILNDAAGRTRLHASLDRDGAPGIGLFGPTDDVVFSVPPATGP